MDGQVSHADLVEQLRRGGEQAAAEVYGRYADRLLALARSRLSRKLGRRLDAEDIVQSAYRSFFIGAREGEYSLDTADDLWRLLAAIVINKLRRQAKRHRARRRALGREADDPGGDRVQQTDLVESRQPSVVDVLIAADELTWLLGQLEPRQRVAVERRLQQCPIETIARELDVNERTIGRWLAISRDLLVRRQQQDDGRPKPPAPAEPRAVLRKRICDRGIALVSPSDYVLEQMIGSGGVSKVYLARQRTSGERVCMKVLRKSLRGNLALTEWFINEANLVGRLNYPHIVPIRGAGILADGGLCLVMQWIDGENLAVQTTRAPLCVADAIRIARTVAGAVNHAHQHGVLHCDLKPQNVLIEQTGKVWLTDFGFGRSLRDGDTAAENRAITGTEAFMAPEQLLPDKNAIGAWTDSYGLAMLTRKLLSATIVDDAGDSRRIRSCLEPILTQGLAETASERPSVEQLIKWLDAAREAD